MGYMSGTMGGAFNPSGAPNGLNQLPIDMNGQVLTGSDPREMDGTFNAPTPQVGVGSGGLPPGDAGVGMGGKGGMPMPGGGAPGMGGKSGGPLAQIPIDMQGNLLGPDQPQTQPMPEPTSMGGLPPAPNAQMPLGKVSGGTPGRPSASAPMVPRGPGFNNPGAPGNPPPQPPERGILTNPQGQPQPFMPGPSRPVNPGMIRPARPAPAVRAPNPYRPAPTVAQPVRLAGRGAGRGGLLR